MVPQLPLIFRKRILTAQPTLVPGVTGSAPSAVGSQFRVDDRTFKIVRPTILRQAQGTFGSDKNVSGAAYTTLNFKTMIAGAGAAAVPAWAATFLQACGMTSGFSTTMDQTQWQAIAAQNFIDGREYQMVGGMGTFKMTGEAGKPGMIDWTFTGGFVADPAAGSLPSGLTYETVQPPPFAASSAFTFNGQTVFRISKFEFDLGNDVKPREDPTQPGGYSGGWIGNRQPKVSVDPEAMAFAVENFYAAQTAGTEIALVAVFGTVANNIVTLTTTLQLESSPEDGDRNGKLIDNLKLVTVRDLVTITCA